MDLTVVVATFGDQAWINLAHDRAIPSAEAEGVRVIHRHADSLAQARNEGLRLVGTEFVCHLDADDALEPGFVEAMARGTADVRGPMARYVEDGRERLWQPRVAGHLHDCTADCLEDGNWLLCGSVARTQLLREVGGWEEWPVYEDWAIFLRCHRAGASFELVPDAIYRAFVRRDSRNRGPAMKFKNRIHHEIVASVNGEAAA